MVLLTSAVKVSVSLPQHLDVEPREVQLPIQLKEILLKRDSAKMRYSQQNEAGDEPSAAKSAVQP